MQLKHGVFQSLIASLMLLSACGPRLAGVATIMPANSAVPGADPAILADRFGKTLQNALSGVLAKPPPHLRFVALGGVT